jgi:hypothetical protein
MDKEFQTSFVPKKAVVEGPKKVKAGSGAGIFGLISLVLFLASIASVAGAYFYRLSIKKNIETYKTSLIRARNAFEPALITELQILDKRLNAGTTLLTNHIVVSPVFELLQDITLPTVRYSDFSYEIDPRSNFVNIKLKGEAMSYNFIALQADLFNKNKFIRNPIFSDFVLDQSGNIDFNLSFFVDKSLVNYESFLDREDPFLFDSEM